MTASKQTVFTVPEIAAEHERCFVVHIWGAPCATPRGVAGDASALYRVFAQAGRFF